jgi:hypothetical protein
MAQHSPKHHRRALIVEDEVFFARRQMDKQHF